MGVQENRYATEIRRRLIAPPNAVPDLGINLRRNRSPDPESTELPPKPNKPEVQISSPAFSNPPLVVAIVNYNLTAARIVGLISKHSGFAYDDLMGGSRRSKLSFARHVAIWLCLKYFPNRSLCQHASIFRKDHTSIIHARERINRYLATECPKGDMAKELIKKVESDLNAMD